MKKQTHFRGAGLQSMPRGSGEVPSCLCLGGLRLCIFELLQFTLSFYNSKIITRLSIIGICNWRHRKKLGFLRSDRWRRNLLCRRKHSGRMAHAKS